MNQATTLQSLPPELIREIGLYLEYGDVQSFRLVCVRVNEGVQDLALSRLRLDWYLDNESYSFVFPLDKVQAYLPPGTRAFSYVRHLTIHRVCPALTARSCPFDDLLRITEPPIEDCWNSSIPRQIIQKRATFFEGLMKVLLSSGLLNNLITIKWEVNCTLPDHGSATPCEEFLKLFATIICQRQIPMECIEITCGLFGILPGGHSAKLAWPCRELRILEARNDERHSMKRSSVPWIANAMAHSPSLRYIDTDLTFDCNVISALFKPYAEHSPRARPPVQFRTLHLAYAGNPFKPHVFGYLRHLRKLNVWLKDDGTSFKSYKHFHKQMSHLWQQFAAEKIYIEELRLNLPDVEHALLDYLASYPRGVLKGLSLYSHHESLRSGYETQDLPLRFFTGTLPAVSAGLEELYIKADRHYLEWCLGVLPESRMAFRYCRVLKSVFMTADPELDPMETSDLVHQTFGGLPYLREVKMYDSVIGVDVGIDSGDVSAQQERFKTLLLSSNDQDEHASKPQQRPRSKSRTIIRMLTTKLSTPRQPPTRQPTNAFSKEHREAALRERGLLPPLPMSQQEAMLDRSIPIVSSATHTRDPSQPSAADLIKKEWETKNKKPSDDERERMNGFKFGATSPPNSTVTPATSTHRTSLSATSSASHTHPTLPQSPANPNGDKTPAPPSRALPQPPARRSTISTPEHSASHSRTPSKPTSNAPSRANSRPTSRTASPLPSRSTSPITTPNHKPNEDSFSSIMEKSIQAVFASPSTSPSPSPSPTPVPTPKPSQSATNITATTPIPTSSFLQAHKRTPTNTTSLSDTLSTSPPPSLFSNKLSPTTGQLSASASSSASDALTSDTSAESSPNLPSKPASGILDRVLASQTPATPSKTTPPQDPLDTPPPVPIKNLKLSGGLVPKGKLGGLSVNTKEGDVKPPEVVISPGPVGGAFVVLTPGGSSDLEAPTPIAGATGARSSEEAGEMLSSEFSDDDDEHDVRSQSAHTEGHLMVGGKGKKMGKRGMTDPGSPAPGNKFSSSVSASGHGSNVRTVGAASPPPVARSGGWMSSVKRSVVGTLVRRGDKDKEKKEKEEESRGRVGKGFNASHLPPSPTLPGASSENLVPPQTQTQSQTRSNTLSPSSSPPPPSSFWGRATPTPRTNARSQTLSPPTSPRVFSYYASSNTPAVPASPRKAVSPVVYSAGSISKETSAIEDEETRRMTELAFMG
ncbi:hypothetical protein CVT24_000030 [Panaeolus cyanescens]|uniref:F-box domain-containing protein n=1 Tax=Panaeolus cyanescens TaxID=181874 RepID=A0A409VSD8_9AGAR|nr:hypothetical protein CVT24_000030 [Panaeolus cyanescens]